MKPSTTATRGLKRICTLVRSLEKDAFKKPGEALDVRCALEYLDGLIEENFDVMMFERCCDNPLNWEWKIMHGVRLFREENGERWFTRRCAECGNVEEVREP